MHEVNHCVVQVYVYVGLISHSQPTMLFCKLWAPYKGARKVDTTPYIGGNCCSCLVNGRCSSFLSNYIMGPTNKHHAQLVPRLSIVEAESDLAGGALKWSMRLLASTDSSGVW